jgi:hypothetical protein
MEGGTDPRETAQAVGGTWERAARRVRRLAAQRGVALDEERRLLYDIREVIALRHRLEVARRRPWGDRWLRRALARLVGSP